MEVRIEPVHLILQVSLGIHTPGVLSILAVVAVVIILSRQIDRQRGPE